MVSPFCACTHFSDDLMSGGIKLKFQPLSNLDVCFISVHSCRFSEKKKKAERSAQPGPSLVPLVYSFAGRKMVEAVTQNQESAFTCGESDNLFEIQSSHLIDVLLNVSPSSCCLICFTKGIFIEQFCFIWYVSTAPKKVDFSFCHMKKRKKITEMYSLFL